MKFNKPQKFISHINKGDEFLLLIINIIILLLTKSYFCDIVYTIIIKGGEIYEV